MTRYIVHDFETFGTDPKRDKSSQFAAVMTDENFNILEKYDFYCHPSLDSLPNPEACYVTGVTPIDLLNFKKDPNKEVLSEFDFFNKINDIFSRDNCCIFGFNNISFDDEIVRHGFYRNAIAPYDREFKNGNSRLDMINIVRMFAFLYPNEINIINKDGEVSFKLSDLATANNLKMEHAHDAFSDVETTLELAKFIRNKQPGFWTFWEKHNNKKEVQKLLDEQVNTAPFYPMFAYSTYFGKENQYVKPVICLGKQTKDFKDPNNANYLCLTLDNLENLKKFLSLSVEEAKKIMFSKKEELIEKNIDLTSPIYTIKTNKLPLFITKSMLNPDNLPFDLEVSEVKKMFTEKSPDFIEACLYVKENYAKIKSFITKVVTQENDFDPCIDSDLGLYSKEVDLFKDKEVKDWIGFLNHNIEDKKLIPYFTGEFSNSNPLMEQFAKRLILRNFLPDLKEECRQKNDPVLWQNILNDWKNECYEKITTGVTTSKSRPLFIQSIATIKEEEYLKEVKKYIESDDPLKQKIGKDLSDFYNMIMKFCSPPENKNTQKPKLI